MKRVAHGEAKRTRTKAVHPPRYDEIYLEGLAQLDRLAGDPIMEVSPDVWKSKDRFDPDLPS